MKPLVEWTDELSVGVQEIDEQHKILVGLVNRMYESIVKRTDQAEIKRVLDELAQYTVIHFAVEESLMRIFDYPDYEIHKKHHEELTKQVVDLQKRVTKGEGTVSIEVLHFLRHWLTHHILQDDKRYGPFLLGKGLKSAWTEKSWVGKIWEYVHPHK
ncbi:hemerythrin-like metal-binding domain-containing protein [Beggiatoa alba B18LD]|uniref:Hemerythrin-like metal-binding domain-containing protein n=1 Tax=Beggiatoa alba B18LD TaxID=395493 RepID=I3CD94_9GAMM|nr:bacteriohemerythrin [Beggiatoa alba]EIJ41587.1 hemerythrin-like metal-binding domain-containing protein [Beggiatoa alba B18LD]